jgi:hypothetical protein
MSYDQYSGIAALLAPLLYASCEASQQIPVLALIPDAGRGKLKVNRDFA